MFIYLFILFMLLQFLDVVSTNMVLARQGRERNPIVRWIQSRLGHRWWIPKIGLSALAGVPMYLLKDIGLYLLGVAILFYIYIVIHNFGLLFKN